MHRERRVVPFTPEQFFDVVADVDSYKKFVPFCVDSRVVRRINQNIMDADMSVGFKVLQATNSTWMRCAGNKNRFVSCFSFSRVVRCL